MTREGSSSVARGRRRRALNRRRKDRWAALSLAGIGATTAATASADPPFILPAATTIGVAGDGKPDFQYNPSNGDVLFFTDGGTFTTTGGAPSFVSSLSIASASGTLIPGGAMPAFQGGTGATLTTALLASAITASPGFTDGFDIGAILPIGLTAASFTGDLTLKYQVLNGGMLKASDIIIGSGGGGPPPPDQYTADNGNWSTGGNWSQGSAPGATSTASLVSSSGAIVVAFDVPVVTIASLTLGSSGAAGNSMTLAQAADSLTITANESIGTSGNANLNLSGGTHAVNGVLTLGSTSHINQTGGSLTAASFVNNGSYSQAGGTASLGAVSGAQGQIAVGGGTSLAHLTVARFSQANVTVGANALLTLSASAPRVTNTATALSISDGGTLDLANHDLLVDRAATAPSAIKAFLASSYGPDGDWSGPGLTSSVARGNAIKYSIGYADGADASAQSAGVPVDAGHVLVRVVLSGDGNLDGKVDDADIAAVLGAMYNTNQAASYTDGDLNYDGVVNFYDLAVVLSANFKTGQTYLGAPVAGAAAAEGAVATPEPSGIAALAIGASGLVMRRRRRPSRKR
jgi:hypothetical protein